MTGRPSELEMANGPNLVTGNRTGRCYRPTRAGFACARGIEGGKKGLAVYTFFFGMLCILYTYILHGKDYYKNKKDSIRFTFYLIIDAR